MPKASGSSASWRRRGPRPRPARSPPPAARAPACAAATVREVLVPGAAGRAHARRVLGVPAHRRPVDVPHDDAAAGPQRPVDLASAAVAVGDVLEHLHAERGVEVASSTAARSRRPVGTRRWRGARSAARGGEHLRAGVEAHDGALGTDLVEQLLDVEARAAADVEDALAGARGQRLAHERPPAAHVARAVQRLELPARLSSKASWLIVFRRQPTCCVSGPQTRCGNGPPRCGPGAPALPFNGLHTNPFPPLPLSRSLPAMTRKFLSLTGVAAVAAASFAPAAGAADDAPAQKLDVTGATSTSTTSRPAARTSSASSSAPPTTCRAATTAPSRPASPSTGSRTRSPR